MKAKDQFIEWLREKVLQNPQEPPSTVWEEISHSLELEESWEKIGEELELNSVWDRIDTRLDRVYYLRRFERLSYGLSGVAAAIFLLFLWGLEPSDFHETQNASSSLAENQHLIKEEDPQADYSTSSGERKFSVQRAESQISTKESKMEKGKTEPISFVNKKIILTQEPGASLQKGASLDPASQSIVEGDNSHTLQPGIPRIAILEIEKAEFMPEIPQVIQEFAEEGVTSEKDGAYPVAYAGLGTALKVSWLLNNKTLQAMERSSLLTAAPNFQNDLVLVYGTLIRSKLFLQADVYVKDVVGQEYQEYRDGQFGKVEDRLEYQSLGVSLSQVRNQVAYGRFPTYSRLLGGVYGGRLISARELYQNENASKTEEYSRWHVGALAGYEYDTFLSDQFIFTYGVRSRLDLLNIYSGTDQLSMTFRKTRAFSLDFSVSLKYVLKK